MIKVLANNSVQLCCKGKSCPIVTDIGNGMVEILDDYGKKVTMSKEEALQLSDGVRVIAEQQEKKELLLG
jgi:hypothetical protein